MLSAALSRPRTRYWLLLLMMVGVITQIVVLSPKPLEQAPGMRSVLPPAAFVTSSRAVLAKGIPTNRIATYSIDGFRFASVHGVEKQWYLAAKYAFLYSPEQLVHSVDVEINIYGSDGQITRVSGKEATYFLNTKDIEIYGNVLILFPDGFIMRSPYIKYLAKNRRITIPASLPVTGAGKQNKEHEQIEFSAMGLTYTLDDEVAKLHKNVVVSMSSKTSANEPPKKTRIEADHCILKRNTKTAAFTMSPQRPPHERFVLIDETSLYGRARTVQLNYGEARSVVTYLVAKDDVLIRERTPENTDTLRYATSGKAEFDRAKNQVVLTKFPQVYENNDTITGETIILNRDTGIIEVEHSNAYSESAINE